MERCWKCYYKEDEHHPQDNHWFIPETKKQRLVRKHTINTIHMEDTAPWGRFVVCGREKDFARVSIFSLVTCKECREIYSKHVKFGHYPVTHFAYPVRGGLPQPLCLDVLMQRHFYLKIASFWGSTGADCPVCRKRWERDELRRAKQAKREAKERRRMEKSRQEGLAERRETGRTFSVRRRRSRRSK